MAAPYRKGIVESVLAKFAGQTVALPGVIDNIGRRLLPHVIEAMPAEDGHNWGVLEKRTSNPYSVPYDILVWKPTNEHFDVWTSRAISGDEKNDKTGPRRLIATWGNVGVLPKLTWHWCDWRDTQTRIEPLGEIEPSPEPEPEPDPAPDPSGDVSERLARLETEWSAFKAKWRSTL